MGRLRFSVFVIFIALTAVAVQSLPTFGFEAEAAGFVGPIKPKPGKIPSIDCEGQPIHTRGPQPPTPQGLQPGKPQQTPRPGGGRASSGSQSSASSQAGSQASSGGQGGARSQSSSTSEASSEGKNGSKSQSSSMSQAGNTSGWPPQPPVKQGPGPGKSSGPGPQRGPVPPKGPGPQEGPGPQKGPRPQQGPGPQEGPGPRPQQGPGPQEGPGPQKRPRPQQGPGPKRGPGPQKVQPGPTGSDDGGYGPGVNGGELPPRYNPNQGTATTSTGISDSESCQDQSGIRSNVPYPPDDYESCDTPGTGTSYAGSNGSASGAGGDGDAYGPSGWYGDGYASAGFDRGAVFGDTEAFSQALAGGRAGYADAGALSKAAAVGGYGGEGCDIME